MRFVRYWLPPLVWAACVLIASSDLFSAEHTGGIVQAILQRVIGHHVSPSAFAHIHFLVRKSAHLTEYGILGALWLRAIRGERRGWQLRWSAAAVALATVIAIIDETHQSFVASRSGTPVDVVIDCTGAAIAQAISWFCRP